MTRSILLALVVFLGCKTAPTSNTSYTAYTGMTLIDGTASQPIPDALLLIHNGTVVAAGTKNNITIPEGAIVKDMAGKFIVPGFINTHAHVGDVKGIEGGHYSKQNIVDNLAIYARYGITTVVSLGGDRQEAESLRAVNDSTTSARLYIAGAVISGKTPEDAMKVIDANQKMGVDFMKIRVDDNLGTSPKMSEEVYRAVIQRSHELGYKIATHLYYLDDARKLLEAGSDFVAHSVRDKAVDEEFIGLIKTRKVCYCPTLTRELSTYVYGDTAEFFSDPFFLREFDSLMINPLNDPARQREAKASKAGQTYKQHLPLAMANLKTLSDRGVPIAMGTDSGIPTRFIGYFEHVEMAMMAEAGMSPAKIIQSATKDAAECLALKKVGSLVPGNFADFVVLTANPLEDIKNTRSIESVFVGGHEIVR